MRALVMYALVMVAGVCAKPKGYVVNEANGIAYRIIYQSQPWDVAKEMCAENGGKLAVPKTPEEFHFIQKLVRGMHYPHISGTEYKLLVWLGIHNLDNYKVWKNIDDENIEDTGFHTWAGQNGEGYSDSPSEPHCAGVDAANPGLREYWCKYRQPYMCQMYI